MYIKVVDTFYFLWNDFHALHITWIKFSCLTHTSCVWILSRVWGLTHKALLSFTPSFSYKLILQVSFFYTRCTYLHMFCKISRSFLLMVSFYKLIPQLGMSPSTPPPPEATWYKSKIEQYWQIILKQAFKRQCVCLCVCVCVCVCVCNVLYDICDFFRVYMCVWMHANTCPKCVCLCVVYITGSSLVAKSPRPTLMTPWTVASQASPSAGFPRQESWSGLPFPSPGDLPDPDRTWCISCIGRQIFCHWATRDVYGIIQR